MAMAKLDLTVERLRHVLRYDRRTGRFFWREGGFKKQKGAEAGCLSKALGYVFIGLDLQKYYAHELAWLYVHGRWPDGRLEFVNGVKSDTRISNLRQHQKLVRCLESKVCPICADAFSRNAQYSDEQWAKAAFCSKECVQEQRRRERLSGTFACVSCGARTKAKVYVTSSGRISRHKLCTDCWNAKRNPKRRHRDAMARRMTPERYLWLRARANARQRGGDCDLSLDDFIKDIGGKVPQRCPALGIKLDILGGRRCEGLPTIDRIDSSKPYVRGNLAVISWKANALKRDGTAEEHRKIAKWMDAMARRSPRP